MQLDLPCSPRSMRLLEEGAGVAARLHVTASVMTRSLGRIIHTTGDQAPSRELDPATLERTFTLRRHDSWSP